MHVGAVDPAACTACRLHRGRTRVVLPDGPAAGLLAIGEAPGRQEDIAGVGFVGRAGRTLDAVLERLGVARQAYARTNVVRCRPPENRKPRADEVVACRPWLEDAVRGLHPRVILAVGQSAATQVMSVPGGSGYLDLVQDVIAARRPLQRYLGIPVVPMPHTSPLAWNRRRPDGTPIRELGVAAAALAVARLST